MAFGIIRARNLSAGDLSSTDLHNARLYKTESEYPENIKPGGTHFTRYMLSREDDYLYAGESSLKKAIDYRLEQNNVKGIRKNSNLAIEYVCTINDKKAWDFYSFSGFVLNTKKWLEQRHGKNSVVCFSEHEDETNPHVHFIVVPLKEKEVHWKNAKSAGKRKEVRLNTREFTGGRGKLRKLQEDYYKHLVKRYHYKDSQGETKSKLGVLVYRGILAEEQLKTYSRQTDYKIARLRALKEKEEDKVKELEIALKIAKETQNKLNNEIMLANKIKKRKEYNRNNWSKKGTSQNQEIFHQKKRKSKGI